MGAFKLDENLGPSARTLFVAQGHDAETVHDEGLGGADDAAIQLAAAREDRVLVTLDHDFGNVVRFPPARTPGIAVLNPPGPLSRALLDRLVGVLLQALAARAIRGMLWIVEPDRIREHGELAEDTGSDGT